MRRSTVSCCRFIVAVVCLVGLTSTRSEAAIVTVLPIQVGDGNGNFANSQKELYLAATNKIWAQAGISFKYLPFTSIISSTFFTLDNQAEVNDLYAQAPGASSTPGTISMWFVKDHFDAYGEANELGGLNANRIVVTELVFMEGRLDTIAHELGHLLGLDHEDVDPGVERDFLMRGGDDRITPTSINDIYPDGSKLDKLTAAQITKALADPKVTAIPEPSSLAFLAVIAISCVRNRRRKRVS